MKANYYYLCTVIALTMGIIFLAAAHVWQNNRIDRLQEEIAALDHENAGQWQRISDFEKMFCNPELIKCGK